MENFYLNNVAPLVFFNKKINDKIYNSLAAQNLQKMKNENI